MATRVRQSTVAPTPRRTGNELPAYEKATFSLNPAAQQALAQLQRTHNLEKLDENLLEAQDALSNVAAEINDRLTLKENASRKRKHEQASQDVDNATDKELEHSLAELRDKVTRMTQRMDDSMRKMIDGRHSVQSIKDSLTAAAEDARVNASVQASTQHIQSQPQRRRRNPRNEDGESDDDANDNDEEYQDFEPTDPAINTQNRPSALDTFKSKVDDAKTRYFSHTLTARYADNNEYRDFRRVVHDAKHPDDNVPLAHHTAWFPEDGPPAPGVTTRARNPVEGDEEDEDNDIAVSRATVSTRCPISLTELKNPLTSKKCPHSFESESILAMISTSATRPDGRPNGERCVRCPVSGCFQMLSRADLQADAVLIRKIKRIQRARELENEDQDEDENNGGGPKQTPTIIDDGDDAADVDDIVEDRVVVKTQMKKEARNAEFTAGQASASAAPRSSAAVVDLGNSTDDDEAEEENTIDE